MQQSPHSPTRFGFVTCVQLGLACLHAIEEAGGRVDAILTLPDESNRTKSGRVFLDDFCAPRNIPLGKFGNINQPEAVAWLRHHDLDWLFVIGWSQIAGASVLTSVRKGAIGMHPTLLPIGRGRASIPWAILKGLDVTGVSMFVLDEGVDTGALLAQEEVPVESRETATTLYFKIAEAHKRLMLRTWPLLRSGRLQAIPQDHSRATTWPRRRPEDGRLDRSLTVLEADRLIRAVTHPYPGAFIDDIGSRYRIWSALPVSLIAPPIHGTRLLFSDGELIVLDGKREY